MSRIGAAEIIALSFGTLGGLILIFSAQETAGASIVSSALTSYFAYKRGEQDSEPIKPSESSNQNEQIFSQNYLNK
jgi:hypothetical protein